MATLTIRNLPDDVVRRLKAAARQRGHSMEQEVRALLERRYAARAIVASRVRERWSQLPPTSATEIKSWRDTGRP